MVELWLGWGFDKIVDIYSLLYFKHNSKILFGTILIFSFLPKTLEAYVILERSLYIVKFFLQPSLIS